MHVRFVLLTLCLGFSACGVSQQQHAKRQKVLDHIYQHLVFVKGGSFMMGHPQIVGPVHKVQLDSFSIMAYETTYGEYDTFAEETGHKKPRTRAIGNESRAPQNAAWLISWNGANDYCHWLADISGLPFALPTEAQWEFAATSRGSSHAFYATDDGTQGWGRNYRGGPNTPWYPDPPGTPTLWVSMI